MLTLQDLNPGDTVQLIEPLSCDTQGYKDYTTKEVFPPGTKFKIILTDHKRIAIKLILNTKLIPNTSGKLQSFWVKEININHFKKEAKTISFKSLA